MQAGLSPSLWKICKHAFVYEAEFLGRISGLPDHVQRQARESYRFFESNPNHPSLDFKRVSQRRPVYSVRVSIDYRALGVLEGGDIVWFWIGPHHEYDRLLRRV